jgi:Na+/H+ antiporter NhaC
VTRTRLILAGLVVVLVTLAAWLGGGVRPPGVDHFGWVSVLPALAVLCLVFVTREVVSSLVFGILVAGLVTRAPNVVQDYFLPALATETFAVIVLVYFWSLGGLIGIWGRTGGAAQFAAWAGDRLVRGPRSAKTFTWVLGVVFHQGGTVSTVLTGTTARPLLDRERVSHEESSYLVDVTAAPVATLVPLNVWPLYIAGLVVGTAPVLATEAEAVSFFFRSIPLNFYALIAVGTALLFALELLPWEGRRMRGARERAREQDLLDRPEAVTLSSRELDHPTVPAGYKPSMVDFLVPLGVLIGVAASGVVPGLLAGDLSAIGVPIAEAFTLSVASAFLLALARGMGLRDAIDGIVNGIKGVTIGALVLGLAVTLGHVSRSLGAAAWLVDATAGSLPAAVLPAALFLLCMSVAFSIGSSFSTFAVVFPIALPLAWALQPDPTYLSLCFGAVVGGGVFGDQCSPISDTSILSALATGGDLMDHTLTQLPIAAAGAAAATGLYLLMGVALG